MVNNFSRIRGRSFAAALTISALALGTIVGAAPATAAVDPNTGSIGGTVTQNTNGTVSAGPLTSVSVYSDPTKEYVAGADTDADGLYSITGLAAGSYVLQFSPQEPGGLAPEFFDDSADYASAQRVVVAAGPRCRASTPCWSRAARSPEP
ncbi:MAG TPA: hypothetical protein VLO31_00380 [Cryobacterium sp.]|nr:hypothetical protein [Cryobacterium sp.]